MAEAPEIHADKIVQSKSRSHYTRCEEIGERKLSCPFCCRSNLTLRKIVQHHSWEGVSSRYRVGIMCSELGCMYVCTPGIGCFYRHLKAFHGGRKQTPYLAVPVDICGDQGRHTRVAVGSNALPLGIAVEIDAIVQLK